ncbi:MAG: UDP-N-acetylmuramoyl-tripeptide--D-alanyl-D-alanine ligase [Gammaproteobacteria bacterium]|nr:UDP-N-acetylmuramoyl-tripeptide--D-alanyl-D-alanine ligase [Gammaproteobacteria bacterium]
MQLKDLDPFTRVSIDSRTLQKGDVFVAIRGGNFDGHDFVADAAKRGAKLAIVEQSVKTKLPLIIVKDTKIALGYLAKARKKTCDIKVVAVTGSCGKTTTKEMIASILNQVGATLSTTGNLNNDIGLPLTMLRLTPEHKYAVLEMGASSVGEIDYLTKLAEPNVAVITNAGEAHLEDFGSIANIAKAKGEIFNGLKSGGTAIVNLDDNNSLFWLSELKQIQSIKVLTFGLQKAANIRAKINKYDENGCATFNLTVQSSQCYSCEHENLEAHIAQSHHGNIDIGLQLPGEHNVMNALAAASATFALGVPLSQIKSGLEEVQSVAMRLKKREGINGALIFDDTYNANPSATIAAIKLLAALKGEKFLVLGEMASLGSEAERFHYEVGAMARDLGIDRLFACGEFGKTTAKGFGKDGVYFKTKDELVLALLKVIDKNSVVLIKGSRISKMEEVVDRLCCIN